MLVWYLFVVVVVNVVVDIRHHTYEFRYSIGKSLDGSVNQTGSVFSSIFRFLNTNQGFVGTLLTEMLNCSACAHQGDFSSVLFSRLAN